MEVKRRTARTLVSRLGSVSEQARSESLAELRLLTKHDPEIRQVVADAGAIPYLAESLYSASHEAQENAAATLLNVSISSRESLMSTRGLLDALYHALRHHASSTSSIAVQSVAATLHSLLVSDAYRPIIGARRDLLYALVDIVRAPASPPRSVKDALKALFGVALYPLNRPALVGLGAVGALFSLVLKDGRVGIVEDATAVIAQVAGCEDSEAEFARVFGVRVLLDLLDTGTGSSPRVKENAIAALLNLARSGGEGVRKELREIGAPRAVEGIKEVLESGTERGRTKASALLMLIEGSGSCDGWPRGFDSSARKAVSKLTYPMLGKEALRRALVEYEYASSEHVQSHCMLTKV